MVTAQAACSSAWVQQLSWSPASCRVMARSSWRAVPCPSKETVGVQGCLCLPPASRETRATAHLCCPAGALCLCAAPLLHVGGPAAGAAGSRRPKGLPLPLSMRCDVMDIGAGPCHQPLLTMWPWTPRTACSSVLAREGSSSPRPCRRQRTWTSDAFSPRGGSPVGGQGQGQGPRGKRLGRGARRTGILGTPNGSYFCHQCWQQLYSQQAGRSGLEEGTAVGNFQHGECPDKQQRPPTQPPTFQHALQSARKKR